MNDNKKIVYLYQISSQEEIFCQNYVISVDAAYAAFHAKYSIDDLPDRFDDLNISQVAKLGIVGNSVLEKKHIKQRISEISRIEAEEHSCCTLGEILNYLSICIRKSKWDIDNIKLMQNAIKATETLIKRYPDFAEGQGEKDKLHFSRGV